MVAVVSGSGLGLLGTSVAALGGIGANGAAAGRGNDRVHVNAATGNLIVQSQDEVLSSVGLDLRLIRTYNSQGLLDDDNGDNWRLNIHQRLYNVPQQVNTAGSTITKVFGDGREVVYRYDQARSAYISSEGDGAHDTLEFSDGAWTWTEGSSQAEERYDEAGRLTASRDADGNTVTYEYDEAGLLTTITDASDQVTTLEYSGRNLTAIHVVSGGATQSLTTYEYDSSDRLTEVHVDLTPADANDSLVYTTTYTYDGGSNRIATITQSDGSSVGFTYQLIDGQQRVHTYTDGAGRITTFDYALASGTGGGAPVAVNVDPSQLTTGQTTGYQLDTGALTGLGGWQTADLMETGNYDAHAPQIAFDAAGNGILIWAQGTDILMRRYSASTGTWSAETALDARSDEVFNVLLSVDRATGDALVGWVQSDGTAYSMYARRFDAATGAWSTTQLVENASGEVWPWTGNSWAAISGDHAAIAWMQHDGTSSRVYLSRLVNGAWTAPALIDTSAEEAEQPQVAVDSSGNVTVLWRQFLPTDGEMRIYIRRWDNTTQSLSSVAMLDNDGDRLPRIEFDANGSGIAAWGGGANVRHYDAATGQWGAQITLSGGEPFAGGPQLSVDANGDAVAAWLEYDANWVLSLYASRYDAASGTWSAAQLLENLVSTVNGDNNIAVSLANGEAVVAWTHENGTAADAYAVRFSGGVWGTPTLLESGDMGAGQLHSAIDAAGNPTVVWIQADGWAPSVYRAQYVGPYYSVPSGATWQSLANTLYGVNSAAAGSALQAAMGSITLTTGMQLTGLPATLNVVSSVPAYYLVEAGDTWASITAALYGTSDSAAIAALQIALGNPSLTPGTHLDVPATLNYTPPGAGTALYLQTDVTDASGAITRYEQNSSGWLTAVTVDPSGLNLRTQYGYDSDGNVTSVIEDPNGLNRRTTFEYDGNGNLLLSRDAAGNTVTRTYNSNNQLLTETHYLVADPDGAGSAQPSAPLTTRYVYDAENHLRFVISAQGRVAEHRYDDDGQRTLTRRFTGATYSATGFAESDLIAWAAAQDLQALERIDYAYDLRGNLSTLTAWMATTSTGVGAGIGSITRFVYDQRGQLLQTIDARGSSTPDASNSNLPYATTYTYDGLGRVLSTTQWTAASSLTTTLTSYDDANRRTITTLANGLITTSAYNGAGELISVTNGTSGATAALGTTAYTYDAAGRLRIVTDPTGSRQFYFYDDAGRKIGEVDGDGTLTELVYDDTHKLIKTIQYAALIDTQGNPADVEFATLRMAASGHPSQDRITRTVYDDAGQPLYAIDELGAVTKYVYDGAGRLTDEVRYANVVVIDRSVDQVRSGDFTLTVSADDRRTRHFYDADGKQRGTLDAEGYLVEYRYDAAGRLVQQIGYANQTPLGDRPSGTLAQLIASAGTDNETSSDPERDSVSYFFYDGEGRKIGVLDAEGYLTETVYDAAGKVSSTTRYDRALTYTAGTSTFQSLKAAATGATSRTTSYQYDGAGRLTRETNYEGTVTVYDYDNLGQLISTTRAAHADESRTTRVRYDFLGRVTHELTGEGFEQLAALANPTAEQVEDIWTRYSIIYAYDLAGRKISATVRPNNAQTNTTLYFYDQDNRLRFEVNALGERKQYRYNALNQLTEEIAYVNRISTSGLSGGLLDADRIAALTANADGTRDARTTYEYSLTGRVTSERISRTASSDDDAVTTFLYNALGDQIAQIQQIDATRTLRVDYIHDRRGLLTETRSDASGINVAEGRTYDAFGRLTRTTDARGNAWQTGYDRLGRAITSTDPGTPARVMTYDAFDQVLTRTDALGNTTTIAYDVAQRRVTVTSPEGVVTSTVHNRHGETITVFDGRGTPTSYGYDANGQLASVTTAAGTTTQVYDRAGRQIETIDANNISTVYIYDAANRVLTRSVDPAGLNLTSKTFHDGRGQSVWQQDASGVWTRLQYNRDGELVSVIVDPLEVPSSTSTQTSTTLVGNPTGLNLRTDYTYDLRGKTLTVTEGVGSAQPRVTRYTYDTLGRRTEESVDPSGLNLRTIYTYDGNDNVVAKTDARGDVTRYVYNVRNEPIYSVDGTGAVVLNEYDAEGRVIKTTAYANRISLIGPPALPLAISVDDILLRLQPNAAADQVARTVYNRDGQVHYQIDAMGGVSELTYDAAGNVVQTTRYYTRITVPGTVNETTIGAAITTRPAYDQTERTVYDAANRAIFEIDAEGYVTQLVYDGEGRIIRAIQYTNALQGAFTTNVAPQIVTTAPGSGSYVVRNTDSDRVIRTVYDAAGRGRFSVDGEGYITEFRYDGLGRQTRKIQYAARYTVPDNATVATVTAQVPATPGATEPVEQSIYDAAGRLVRTIDAEGVVTFHVYDAVGRETDTTVAYGTSDASTTHRVFNAAGYLVEETQGYGAAEAAITRYIVDGVGNRTFIIDPRGYELAETDTAWATSTRQSLGYPASSASLTGTQRAALRARYATEQRFDANGNITAVIDPAGRSIGTEYDAFGNAVKITDQRGYSGHFYFDKNNQQTLQVDPEGYVTRTIYTAFGTVDRVTHYHNRVVGTVTTSSAPVIVSAVPNPITGPYLLIDPLRDQTTIFEHDRRDLQTRIIDAENNDEAMTYDAFGNKVTYRDKLDSLFAYTFYRNGKVRTQTSPSVTVTTVDAAGAISTSSQTLVTEFIYDQRGNVTRIREALGLPQQRDTVITYDRLNREVRRDLPQIDVINGTTVGRDTPYTTTAYDRRGNVVEMRAASGARTIMYYDALNRKVAAVDGTGALAEYTYDDAGNLTRERAYATRLTNVLPTTRQPPAANDTYRELEYAYDANNRQVVTKTQRETYFDPLRLATLDNGNAAVTTNGYVTGQIETTTTYDAAGNVVMTVDGRRFANLFFYNRLGQQILSVDALGYVTRYEYDGNGNVIRQWRYEHKLSNDTIADLDPTYSTQAIINEVTATPGQDRVVEFEYDRLGRKKVERMLSVRYATVSDTGVLDSHEQAIQSSFEYDAAGHLIQIIKTDGSQTNYEYDELGRLERQLDPLSNVFNGMSGATVLTTSVRARTEWQYDAFGNRTLQTRFGLTTAENQVIRTRYDEQGNIKSEWDAMSYRTDYNVDAGGRIKRQTKTATDVDGLAHTYQTYFEYDERDREKSRRIHTDGVAGDLTWTAYNAFGDISTRGINGTTQAEYRYDKLGNLLWTNADTGTPRAYVYDATGNAVIEVSQTNGTNLQSVTSPAEVQGIAPQLVQYKFSVYNARNQLTDVFQAPMNFTGLTGALTAEEELALADPTRLPTQQGTVQPNTQDPRNSNPGATISSNVTREVTGATSYLWLSSTPGVSTSTPTYLHPGYVTPGEHGQYPVSLQSNPPYRTVSWNGQTLTIREMTETITTGQETSGNPQTSTSSTSLNYDTGTATTPQTTTTPVTTPNTIVQSVTVYEYESTQVSSTSYGLLGGSTTTGTQIGFIPGQTISISQAAYYDPSAQRNRYNNAVRIPAIAGFGDAATQIVVTDTYGNIVMNTTTVAEMVFSLSSFDPNTTWRLQIIKGEFTLFDGNIRGNANYYTRGAVTVTGANSSINNVQVWLGNGQYANLTRHTLAGSTQWIGMGIGAATNWQYNLYYDAAGASLLGAVSGGSLTDPTNRSFYHSTRTDTQYRQQVRTDPETDVYNRFDTTQVIQQGNYIRQLMYSIISGNTLSNQIHRSSQYNAFGEVIGETDGRDNLTQYQYNELGQVIRKQDPTVSQTDEHGVEQTNFTPVTQYHVDALGQTIGSTDANDFTTRVAMRNGRVTAQFNPDGNVERHYYDVFGNEAASTAPEINLTTTYQYDKNNRLVLTDFAGNNYDRYAYDALGNRISHTNGIESVERYNYDAEGRITRYRSAENRSTSYNYTFRSDIGELGGYRKVTTDAMGNQQIDDVDMYGKVRSHTDLAGRIYTYNYNSAGWLTSQQSRVSATDATLLQNIQYFYYDNGYVKEIKDLGINSTTLFQYDKDGNRTMESYSVQSLVPGDIPFGQTPYQMATATYDALNRVVSIVEDGKYEIEYEYDKVGNRRRVRSEYYDLLVDPDLTQPLVQDFWYEYDSMNRFTTTMGRLTTSGEIVRGATGYDIGYNGANQRISQQTTDKDGRTIKETYFYDDNGFLTDVYINPNVTPENSGIGVRRAQRVNNAVGDKDLYREFNSDGNETSSHDYDYDRDHILRRDHDVANNRGTNYILLADGRLDRSVSYNNVDSNAATITFQYHYENWDSYKQERIVVTGIANGVDGWRDGTSTFDYDVNGHLTRVHDHADYRTIWYMNSHNGQTLKRLQWVGTNTAIQPETVRQFYYLYGKPVGDQAVDGSKAPSRVDYAQQLRGTELEGNGNKQYLEAKRFESMPLQWQQWGLHYTENGSAQPFQHKDIGERVIPVTSADFDQNFQPINATYPPSTAGTYVVVNGDTLHSIAATIWGDGSLWYLLAEANGLSDDVTLTDDMRLVIPNVVTNIHNNATTFRPVDPGLALGDTSPTLPQPPPPPAPKKGCGAFGMILIVIVAIVVTVFTAGIGTAAAGSGLSGIMSAGVATLGGGLSTTALVAGAVGAAASQGVAMALGMQEEFDWSGVAMGAVGSAIGAGIGKLASNVSSLSWLNATSGVSGFGAQAVRGAIGNAATQGISMAAGLQKQFSWSQVAASAVGAGVGNSVGNWLSRTIPNSASQFTKQLVSGFGNAAASAGVYEAITGERANYGMIAAQSFGTALGNHLVETIATTPAGTAGRITARIRADLGDGASAEQLENLATFNQSLENRIRDARRLEQTDVRAADQMMSDILDDALQFYSDKEVDAAQQLIRARTAPESGDVVVRGRQEYGRAFGLLDRPSVYVGRVKSQIDGAIQSWVERTPGAGLALNLADWGLAIAGGPTRLAAGYGVTAVRDEVQGSIAQRFRDVEYVDQIAQDGSSGMMWLADTALNGLRSLRRNSGDDLGIKSKSQPAVDPRANMVSQPSNGGSGVGPVAAGAQPQPKIAGLLTGPSLGKLNAIRGNEFEGAVRNALRAEKGTNTFFSIESQIGTIPDLPIGSRFGVTDIKDVAELSKTAQLKVQLDAAKQAGLPFNLIVSPGTNVISKPLQDAISRTGGRIFQFDPASGKFSDVVTYRNRVVR